VGYCPESPKLPKFKPATWRYGKKLVTGWISTLLILDFSSSASSVPPRFKDFGLFPFGAFGDFGNFFSSQVTEVQFPLNPAPF